MAKQMKNVMPKNKDQKGQSITVYLTNQVIEAIKQEADQEDRSVSYVVNRILEAYYKQQGK